MNTDLAQQALKVLEALASLAANGQQITIAPYWGFGTATLIDRDGAHTAVGDCTFGKDEGIPQERLARFIEDMYQRIVLNGLPVCASSQLARQRVAEARAHNMVEAFMDCDRLERCGPLEQQVRRGLSASLRDLAGRTVAPFNAQLRQIAKALEEEP